jgi:tetratricopeptide (TPR) repeat protein
MGKASRSKRLKRKVAAARSTPEAVANPVKGAPSAWSVSITLHVIMITLLGFLAYSNTFAVPFLFDDYYIVNIVDNPAIGRLSNIPAMLAGSEGMWASRPLLQATLAFNYHFGELEPWGYHAVNTAIHLINGILLYLLVVMTGKHLGYGDKNIRPVALLSALLFIVHPMQTEAVTYIVSRSMLFATTFYLAGIMLFLKSITSETRKGLYIAGLFAVSLMGMGSRENFATFPVMLIIYDLFFVTRFRAKEVLKHYKVYLPVLLSLGYLIHLVLNNTYAKHDDYPTLIIPHIKYVLTQFKVHWTYLRLLLLPLNQNLDYDYSISQTLLEFPTVLAFIGYLGLWTGGILLARKKPYIAFSVLWFLLALFPISFGVAFLKSLRLDDVIFEHRLYLPSVAFFPLTAVGIFRIREKLRTNNRRVFAISLSAILVLVLVSAAFTRNMVWRSKISMWSDVVEKSPMKIRGHNELGIAYESEGLSDKAIGHFHTSLRLAPGYAKPHNNLGFIYFYRKGNVDKAIEHYEVSLSLDPDRAKVHLNLGIAYKAKGLTEKAEVHFDKAKQLNPVLFGLERQK